MKRKMMKKMKLLMKNLYLIDEEIQEKLSKLDRIIKENKIKYHLKF